LLAIRFSVSIIILPSIVCERRLSSRNALRNSLSLCDRSGQIP